MSGPQFLNTCTGVFNMVLPKMGPIVIPVAVDFTVAPDAQTIDFSYLINNNQLDFISGVYLGEALDSELIFVCEGTKQLVVIPVGVTGYFPLMVQNPAKVSVEFGGTPAILQLLFYNFPQYPFAVSESGAGTAVTIANGADVAEGRTDDAAWDGAAANTTVIGALKAIALGIISLVTNGFVSNPSTLTGGTFALTGASQTPVAANAGKHKVIIYNPIGNNPITIDPTGAVVVTGIGLVIQAGGSFILEPGITNAVTVIGTNTQSIIVYKG